MNLESSQSTGDWVERRSPGRVWSPVDEICAERQRQNNKWGEQNYPSSDSLGGGGACNLYGIPSEREAKARVERCARDGRLTWTDILLEEFAEAVSATNEVDRRAELVQVAAVALAWIECIDRRAPNSKSPSECIASCGSDEPCDMSRCPLPEVQS